VNITERNHATIEAVAREVGVEPHEIARVTVVLKGYAKQITGTLGFARVDDPERPEELWLINSRATNGQDIPDEEVTEFGRWSWARGADAVARAAVQRDPVRAQALAVLREVEWGDHEWQNGDPMCPSCGGDKPDEDPEEARREAERRARIERNEPGRVCPPPGHKPDCRLAAALKGATT
jgi:hypothetical protein